MRHLQQNSIQNGQLAGAPRRRFTLLLAASFSLFTACSHHPPPDRPSFANVNANANDILFRAISLVGTPYQRGGNTPSSGFDCSGLVAYVYNDVAHIALPRSAQDMSRMPARAIHRDRLEPGDLVFFRDGRRVSHVGIYAGSGRFVHAPNEGGTVRLDLLDSDYWRDHYDGARRLLP